MIKSVYSKQRSALLAAAHIKQATTALQLSKAHIRTHCLTRWAEHQLQLVFGKLSDMCELDPIERFTPAQPSVLYSDDLEFSLDEIRRALEQLLAADSRAMSELSDMLESVINEVQSAREAGEFISGSHHITGIFPA